MSDSKIGKNQSQHFHVLILKWQFYFKKTFHVEKQLFKGFINLNLRHDILEGKMLNVSVCIRIYIF